MPPLSRSRRTLGLLACLLLTPAVALACLWDSDTLKQERYHFPETLELVTGKFLRHSKEFYQWRIQDRVAKLKNDPQNLAYLDDLAVAYEKVGDHDKAIETILKKEEIQPGAYETYSNLGTFYILAGEFEKGLPFIDKALAINPDAHFGREKYQKWLVEYAMEQMKDGKLSFPMRKIRPAGAGTEHGPVGFAGFVAKRLGASTLGDGERQVATKGVLGMMRFADHENPLLLEALGDLLFETGRQADAKQLAARAYLKAAYGTTDADTSGAYRKLAEQALKLQVIPGSYDQISLSQIETDLRKELVDAQRWYDELHAKELSWIRDGKDVEAEFDRLYTQEPQIEEEKQALAESKPVHYLTLLGIGGLAVVLLTVFLRRR